MVARRNRVVRVVEKKVTVLKHYTGEAEVKISHEETVTALVKPLT